MFCLSLEESVGIPWAITCALLLVAVICHSDPTAAFIWAHQMEVIKWIQMGRNFEPICRVKPGSVPIPRQLGNYQRAL